MDTHRKFLINIWDWNNRSITFKSNNLVILTNRVNPKFKSNEFFLNLFEILKNPDIF